MSRWRLTTVALALIGVAACFVYPRPAAASGCDLYVSPSGSDSAGGGAGTPFATITALDQRLKPGQTGCLESGTYGSVSTNISLGNSGATGAQITITAAPGQAAKLVGFVQIEGSYTTVQGLAIDGSNTAYNTERPGTNCPYPVSEGLEIDGQGDIFQGNDFFQSIAGLRGNGIGVGFNRPANNAIIRDNRIHDVGQCDAYDHLIYLAHGTGVQIYDNWMWNDAHGWGVQIYPGASGADIYNNVIDSAGSGFVIGGGSEVSNNTVEQNVVINSTGLPDGGPVPGVAVSSCCGSGTGNTFVNNVSYGNPGGVGNPAGVMLANNSTANPNLIDPAGHDYRPTTPPLTTWGLWDGGLGTTYGATAPAITPAPAAAALPPASAPSAATASDPRHKHKQHKKRLKRRTHKRTHKQRTHKKHKQHTHKKHKHTHKKHQKHRHEQHPSTTVKAPCFC